MGKRIIQQARGHGSMTYQVRKYAYRFKVGYPNLQGKGKVISTSLSLVRIKAYPPEVLTSFPPSPGEISTLKIFVPVGISLIIPISPSFSNFPRLISCPSVNPATARL